MILLYITVFIVLVVTGTAVGYIVARSSNKVVQLVAPLSTKQLEKASEMKTRYDKAKGIYEFLHSRFKMDFTGTGNKTGVAVINKELISIKKQLVCINFKLQAYNQHIDPEFCKELAKEFNEELCKLNKQFENIAKIWTDMY